MTYLVNDKCIKCKLMDCVEVCPVDCFYEGSSALYLLSDLANGVTGEIHYVDAGYNKVGMPDPKNFS